MLKKLFILSTVCLLTLLPAKAQNEVRAPKAGDVQFSLVLGASDFFNFDENLGYDYLLPGDGESIGFGTGNGNIGPLRYLNVGNDMNSNSILNLVGLRTSVFLTDHVDLNLLVGINLNITPKKDFIEGDMSDPYLIIPDQQYVMGKTNNLFNVELGSNYHFIPKNERFNIYVGGVTGFQMARIDAMFPHTGETMPNGDSADLYRTSKQQGQAWGFRAGIVSGVDFTVLPGWVIGLELCPFSYQLTMMEMKHPSLPVYKMMNHNIKVFSMPRFKIGFRF